MATRGPDDAGSGYRVHLSPVPSQLSPSADPTTAERFRSAVRAVLGRVTVALWRDRRCIFVLSTGRTGTKSLAALLGLCPGVAAHHEPAPKLLLERKAARRGVYAEPGRYRRIFAAARGYPLLRLGWRGTTYAETSPRLTFFAPVIADLLPHAKFVYLHREPAAVIRSAMRRRWYAGHYLDYARITPEPGEAASAHWASWDAFTKMCWYWETYNRFALEFARQVGRERVLVLAAERLFDGTALAELFDFLGVERPDDAAVAALLQRKLNAQTGADYPGRRDWTPEQWRILTGLAGATMRELGYPGQASDA